MRLASRLALSTAIATALLTGSAEAGFDPVTLFGVSDTGWVYDLSDMATLFQDAAGTTPVTAVGQPVGRCLDLSGKGNHRTQSTALNRPTYARHPLGGIRNLLTGTEDPGTPFHPTSVSETVNDAVGITGQTTMSKLTVIGGSLNLTNAFSYAASRAFGFAYTYSVCVRPGSYRYFSITLLSTNNRYVTATVDTQTVQVTASRAAADYTLQGATIEDLGGGLFRVSISGTPTTSNIARVTIGASLTSAAVTLAEGIPYATWTNGDFWHAGDVQLELGSTATAYQRVGSTFDVTEAGVEDLYYLSYDGINDSLATASFAWGTDKATICAGVRKLSDATVQMLCERSVDTASNAGTFRVTSSSGGLPILRMTSRGAGAESSATETAAAPITKVITGIGDISGDLSTLRLNGTQVAQSTSDQGTGNYLTYPVYFGARAGTSLFFNGREYSNVGINRLLTTDELAALESWTAGRTGVTL